MLHKVRNIAVVLGLVALSTAGAALTAQTAHSAAVGTLAVCHATTDDNDPYQLLTPAIDSTGLEGGHLDHTGPVWTRGLVGSWGDVIPPFDYTNSDNATVHYPGLNWDAAGQQILANGCVIPFYVTLPVPFVSQSQCIDLKPTNPSVTLPTTPGVTYSISPAPVAGGSSTVIATAHAPQFWFSASSAFDFWEFVDVTHERFPTTFFPTADCSKLTGVEPVDPIVTESTCAGNPPAPTAPTLSFSRIGGIDYVTDKDPPYQPGESIDIVASILDPGGPLEFVHPAPPGWTYLDKYGEERILTFAAAPDCSATGPLAATGVPSQQFLVIGCLALVLGLCLQFGGSFRRAKSS